MKSITIATRASKLALIQTNLVMQLLESACPDIKCSIREITTKGDRDKSDFLYKANSTGFFTTEVENALLDGKADLAVHSLKDLPTENRQGLTIAAIPKRERANDVLITNCKINSINDLPSGITIGTSSLRRIAQLKRLRDDIECAALRGNIETRLRKVREKQVDAIVIAYAGLSRLNLCNEISLILPVDDFIPAPAQGALAIQIRDDDTELAQIACRLDDKNTRIAVENERAVLKALHGGCSIPLGVYCQVINEQIKTNAMLCDIDGKRYVRQSIISPVNESEISAQRLAKELLSNGGQDILTEIKKS